MNIYIPKIPSGIEIKNLRQIFSEFGAVRYVKVGYSVKTRSEYCIVSFEKEEVAQQLIARREVEIGEGGVTVQILPYTKPKTPLNATQKKKRGNTVRDGAELADRLLEKGRLRRQNKQDFGHQKHINSSKLRAGFTGSTKSQKEAQKNGFQAKKERRKIEKIGALRRRVKPQPGQRFLKKSNQAMNRGKHYPYRKNFHREPFPSCPTTGIYRSEESSREHFLEEIGGAGDDRNTDMLAFNNH